MQIIPGKQLALQIQAEVKEEVAALKTPPGLAVLLVGDDAASHLYVSLKEKAATEAGIKTTIQKLNAETSDDELVSIIESWNADDAIQAILVQLPLPKNHDTNRIIEAINPAKDVDGFHPENTKKLLLGEGTIIPPVHESIIRLIGETGLDPKDKSATILANSETFAEPLSHILQRAGFVTKIMHPDELDQELLLESDVIVSAIGRCNFVRRDLVKDGAILIDVGTSKDIHGKTCGDIDAESVESLNGYRSPVPGGVGPMTVALLLKNVVRLTKKD